MQRNGGDVVANPLPSCFVIVGDKRTMQTKSLIDAGKNDVLSFQYIIDALNGFIGNEDGNPNPSHFLGYTAETRSVFSGMFDEFGDSFTEDIDESQLKGIFCRFDDTMQSLQRKRGAAEKGKKIKKAKTEVSEHNTSGDSDRVNEILQRFEQVNGMKWRQILKSPNMDDSDYADILDGNAWNTFWRNNAVLVIFCCC